MSCLIFQVVHTDFLPDRVFEDYDDYYYYEDEEDHSKIVKRSVRSGSKRCSSKTHCCRCLEKNKDLTIQEYRKYYNFFLTDNPNSECPKSGHAAYSDAVRVAESPKTGLDSTYDPAILSDLTVTASNFMVISPQPFFSQ